MHPSDPKETFAASVPFKKAYTEEALASRRAWTEATTGSDLSALDGRTPGGAELFKGNIEGHIGFVQIPMGWRARS